VTFDYLKGIRPMSTDAEGDVSVQRWHFPFDYPYYGHPERTIAVSMQFSGKQPHAVAPLAATAISSAALSTAPRLPPRSPAVPPWAARRSTPASPSRMGAEAA
jgi:hypothetical protein